MRLLVIVNVFEPDRAVGAAVFSDLCFTLASAGTDITVRCPYPYYPEWKDKSGMNGWSLWRREERGVKIEHYGALIPRDPKSLWQRLLFEASLFFSLLRSLPGSRHFNVVMVYCPCVGMVAYAGLMRLLFRKPLWLNVQDVASDAARTTGISRLKSVTRLLRAVETFFYNRADVWSSISPIMIERLQSMRARNQPILFMPNWVDQALAKEISSQPEHTPRADNEPIRLLYAGNIGGKQNLLAFCSFLQLTELSFNFRIFGDGSTAREVEEWVLSNGDARFTFGPFLNAADLARELNAADFYVITEKSGVGASFFPSKLVTATMSRTPILAVCDRDSPLGREMSEADLGPLFEWYELHTLPELLKSVRCTDEKIDVWRDNAKVRAAFYDRSSIIKCFQQNLERLAAGRSVTLNVGRGGSLVDS